MDRRRFFHFPHWPLVREIGDILLRLIAVFLAGSLCAFFTVNQPVLRVMYDGLVNYWEFLTSLGRFWDATGARVFENYWHSMLTLVAALALALLIGLPAGFLASLRPHSRIAQFVRILSYMGTTTPSFLLALFIMIFFVLWVLPMTGIRFILISSAAQAFDPRRIVPIALTLTARPLAYFATVTAATVHEVVTRDYVRTAHSKGLAGYRVLFGHIWPNVFPAILSAIPVAMLFSISSLPIIEFVFNWPGVGQELLFRIIAPVGGLATNTARISFLLTSLGMTYVLSLIITNYLRHRADPRTRQEDEQ